MLVVEEYVSIGCIKGVRITYLVVTTVCHHCHLFFHNLLNDQRRSFPLTASQSSMSSLHAHCLYLISSIETALLHEQRSPTSHYIGDFSDIEPPKQQPMEMNLMKPFYLIHSILATFMHLLHLFYRS